jgi:hypothetical protein
MDETPIQVLKEAGCWARIRREFYELYALEVKKATASRQIHLIRATNLLVLPDLSTYYVGQIYLLRVTDQENNEGKTSSYGRRNK